MTTPPEATQGQPRRWLVATMWLNPEDGGHYADTQVYFARDEGEADRAVELANERYDHMLSHRTWAIDLLNPEHVKDVAEFIDECTETLEELA